MEEKSDTPAPENSKGPTKLSEMVHYQEKTVVSRTLVKKSAGTVTLFAFDGNEGLSEHSAPFDAMIVNLEGRADITIAGEHYDLSAGDTITLPANIPHAVKALEPFKMLLIMIRA